MLEDHLEKLKTFFVVGQEKSFVKAAQVIGLTQPAVTKTIRLLEDQFEVSLFLRHRRGVELTKAGVLLQQYCEGLFVKTRDIEKKIRSTQELAGVIRIGTYETLGELFWPKVLKFLQKSYPDLTVELTTQDPATIWDKLEFGAIDLIVDAEPKTGDHLYSKVLYTDRFGLFCKKGSSFIDTDQKIPISSVPRATDRKGVTIEQHLRKMSGTIEFLYNVESFTMVRSLILEDVCVGVLPLRMAVKYLEKGTMQLSTTKSGVFGEHRICATSLFSQRQDPKIEILIKTLMSVG